MLCAHNIIGDLMFSGWAALEVVYLNENLLTHIPEGMGGLTSVLVSFILGDIWEVLQSQKSVT
jgi:hypothetical protein